jgi:predicted ATPase
MTVDQLPLLRLPLVGRADELAHLRRLVLDPAIPLVTLTGPAGVGKTSLALAAADELRGHCRDGVRFLSLAPIGDAEAVLSAVAHALGVPEAGTQPLTEALRTLLADGQYLLVLDNLEHLLGRGRSSPTSWRWGAG